MKMSYKKSENPWHPFELAVSNFWKHSDDTPILVHSDIADTEELLPSYFFRDITRWPHHEIDMLSRVRGTVLEIGAGVGSHVIELQKRGHQVTANEASPVCCKIMQERGVQTILPGDCLEIQGKYETVVLIMNGLGMAGTPNGLVALLKKLRSLLTSDGQILLDASDIGFLHEPELNLQVQHNDNYYGIVTHQFEYCGNLGKSFQWLFVDKVLLKETAQSLNLNVTILNEDKQFGYTAMLNL